MNNKIVFLSCMALISGIISISSGTGSIDPQVQEQPRHGTKRRQKKESQGNNKRQRGKKPRPAKNAELTSNDQYLRNYLNGINPYYSANFRDALKKSSNPDMRDTLGRNLLHAVISDQKLNGQSLTRALHKAIEHGVNPNGQDASKKTPLHYLAEYKKTNSFFKLLLKAKANPFTKDQHGLTPGERVLKIKAERPGYIVQPDQILICLKKAENYILRMQVDIRDLINDLKYKTFDNPTGILQSLEMWRDYGIDLNTIHDDTGDNLLHAFYRFLPLEKNYPNTRGICRAMIGAGIDQSATNNAGLTHAGIYQERLKINVKIKPILGVFETPTQALPLHISARKVRSLQQLSHYTQEEQAFLSSYYAIPRIKNTIDLVMRGHIRPISELPKHTRPSQYILYPPRISFICPTQQLSDHIRQLQTESADFNTQEEKSGNTLLHAVIKCFTDHFSTNKERFEEIKFLIDHGANPTICNKYGQQPIDYFPGFLGEKYFQKLKENLLLQ